ncbi:MAG: DUF2961 domain-containing protein [Verrucomicrobiae bacterium]
MLQNLYVPAKGTSSMVGELHQSVPARGKLLVADIAGPGVIGHIAVTHMNSNEIALLAMRGVVVRCSWDEEDTPSVEVPLGDFFGIGFGEDRPLNCTVWERDGKRSLHIFFPMPFQKRALIELENLSDSDLHGFYWYVEYDKDVTLPDKVEYFHAQYRQSHPVPKTGWHTVLETEGHGKYVGTIWSVNWMENRTCPENAFSYLVDGQPLQCTNSEDYFCQSWGFHRGSFNTLYAGQGLELTKTDCDTTQMSSYRLHLPNPILFEKSFKFFMDCQGYKDGYRCDTFDTVAFWYQSHPRKAFPALPPVEELLPIQCAQSWWRKIWAIHQVEKQGRLSEAVALADELIRLYPHNSKIPDVLFKKAVLLGQLGDAAAAREGCQAVIDKHPQSEATQDATDKLWVMEKPGRLLLTLVTPSGWNLYLDGKEIAPPAAAFAEIPAWGHPVQYRYGRAQVLQCASAEDANSKELQPGDPIPIVLNPYASCTYRQEENRIRWEDSSSSIMRLITLRLEPGVGEHLLAVEARLSNELPLALESQMPGGMVAVLDDGAAISMADGTWRVSKRHVENWHQPATSDGSWEYATVHANESYGDSAWFWLWPRGFRKCPGGIARIWTQERDESKRTLYFRRTIKLGA